MASSASRPLDCDVVQSGCTETCLVWGVAYSTRIEFSARDTRAAKSIRPYRHDADRTWRPAWVLLRRKTMREV